MIMRQLQGCAIPITIWKSELEVMKGRVPSCLSYEVGNNESTQKLSFGICLMAR